jgi:hypothetical protein
VLDRIAPYDHPKLAAIIHWGDKDHPVHVDIHLSGFTTAEFNLGEKLAISSVSCRDTVVPLSQGLHDLGRNRSMMAGPGSSTLTSWPTHARRRRSRRLTVDKAGTQAAKNKAPARE